MAKADDNNFVSEILSQSWIHITDNEFRDLSQLVYDKIGINLTDQKKTLLMGRLQKLLRNRQIKNFQDYYNFVVTDHSGAALSELANFIATNHTFFWRENDHFEFFLKRTIPEIIEQKKKTNSNDIRIWCAGCSSGEESFTLVMLLMEALGTSYNSYISGVLATDISEKALAIARRGVYTDDRVKNMPDHFKKKYFRKISDTEWEIIDRVKSEVTYRRFNLMNDEFPFKKPFDSIFCRNVMIYFDDPTRETLVNKFYDLTLPNGYLFIGHSESLKRDKTRYKYILPAVYKKS